jgi:hypothetical protein
MLRLSDRSAGCAIGSSPDFVPDPGPLPSAPPSADGDDATVELPVTGRGESRAAGAAACLLVVGLMMLVVARYGRSKPNGVVPVP